MSSHPGAIILGLAAFLLPWIIGARMFAKRFLLILALEALAAGAYTIYYMPPESFGSLALPMLPALPPLQPYLRPALWLLGAGTIAFGVKLWLDFDLYLMGLGSAFSQIELELNGLIKKYKGQGSRLQRVKERTEWYNAVAKKDPAIVGLISHSSPFPHTISDDIIGWNEKEAQSKKEARGQATATAYYLTLLLRSSPSGVQRKIAIERAKGKQLFLVPGVEYLAKQPWRMLQFTVWRYKFPQQLRMKKDDGYLYGWDVLNDLIQE